MGTSTKPRVLFSNPPWWVSREICALDTEEMWGLRESGVRAGSRWPFTFSGDSTPGRRVRSDYTPYPFFMGYAASYVKKKAGARVWLRDSVAYKESYDSYFRYLAQEQFDFIVIESASPSWEHDQVLLEQVRRISPASVIVLTGPIATLQSGPAPALDEHPSRADAWVKGEYEKGVVRVLNGERGVIDFDLLTESEMNTAPWPLLGDPMYWDSNPRGQIWPQLQTWSSRGCPYKCIFCVWPASMTGNDPDGTGRRTVRHYSAQYMSEFLSAAVKTDGYRSIYFDDDTFNLGESHVLKMCTVLGRLKIPWSAMCRADGISRDAWREMKMAGCFGVKLGFESGSQEVLDKIVNKRLNLEVAKETARYLTELGIRVHGTFTFGLPGETPEQVSATRRLIVDLESAGIMDTHQESGAAAIEGAPLATLEDRGGSLPAFPAARIDQFYRPHVNGATKLAQLRSYPGNDIEGWMAADELAWLFERAHERARICEVGSYMGRSTHALCSGCPGTVTVIDHFRPVHISPEFLAQDDVYRAFTRNLAGFQNLEINRGSSPERAADYPDGSFDMIFIDGHHVAPCPGNDIDAWRPKLRPGGLLCGHDYTESWPDVVRAVDQRFSSVQVCNTIWSVLV